MIAPYFGDVDATSGHNVFYRSTNDSVLLQQVVNIVSENFGESVDLQSLFIVTWYHIPASGGPVDKVRLFTCTRAASCNAVYDMQFFSVGSRLKIIGLRGLFIVHNDDLWHACPIDWVGLELCGTCVWLEVDL